MAAAPDPMQLHPVPGQKRVVFLKPLVTDPRSEVGDVMSAPSRGDTVVGHDVWLGYGALVLPGVNIGSGAVVAAGSVVASDVPPYAIVAGNPARLARRQYEDERAP